MKRNAPSKRIRNPYGYFDSDAREYVITRPDTPTPWINYLGEGRYGGIISNTAGGFSFDRDPRNRRVTRYRYNSIPADQPGRYIYIRDAQDGEFWSPTVQPTPDRKLTGYECRHGAGYTRISSSYKGIAASVLYFVPPSPPEETCPCELWVLTLRNTTKPQAHAAHLLLRRILLLGRGHRPAERRLGPADLLLERGGRHPPGADQIPPDLHLGREFDQALRLRHRPRRIRRPDARPFQSADGGKRQAREHPRPAREQHRLALAPRHAQTGRGEDDRLHARHHRHAGAHPRRRETVHQSQGSGSGVHRPARGLGQVPGILHRRNSGSGNQRDAQRLESDPVPGESLLVAVRVGLRYGPRARAGDARHRPGYARRAAQSAAPGARDADDDLEAAIHRRPYLAPGLPAHRRRRARAGRGIQGAGRNGSPTTTCG